MPAIFGGNGYLELDSNNMSIYLKSGGLDSTLDTIDVSTWGDASKDYITGLEDGSFSLEGVWDETVDGYMSVMKGVKKPFTYGPAGNTAGMVEYSGNGILTSYNIGNDISGEVRFSATFQVTGGVTRGTF